MKNASKNGIKVASPPDDVVVNGPKVTASPSTSSKTDKSADFMQAASKHGIKVASPKPEEVTENAKSTAGGSQLSSSTPKLSPVANDFSPYYTPGQTYHGPVVAGTEGIPLDMLQHMFTPFSNGMMPNCGASEPDHDIYKASPIRAVNDSTGLANVDGSMNTGNTMVGQHKTPGASVINGDARRPMKVGEGGNSAITTGGANAIVKRIYSDEYMLQLKDSAVRPGEFKNYPVVDGSQKLVFQLVQDLTTVNAGAAEIKDRKATAGQLDGSQAATHKVEIGGNNVSVAHELNGNTSDAKVQGAKAETHKVKVGVLNAHGVSSGVFSNDENVKPDSPALTKAVPTSTPTSSATPLATDFSSWLASVASKKGRS